MKKERKNKMKKMIAEFIMIEYDNPRLKAIRNADEKAFDKVVQKMRDGEVLDSQNHRQRCRQGRENFEKNFLKDFHYTVKGPNITSSGYMKTEPTGDYNDITGMRNTGMVRNTHKDLKPEDSKSRTGLCPYKVAGFISYYIDSIKVDLEDGLERRSFIRILSVLGSLCIEYAKLANAAYGTKIDEKWAEDGLLKLDSIVQHRWNKEFRAPLKDDKQNQKTQ